jgi:large subunit ribosomal protein L21
MDAIISTGGKQYKVKEGAVLKVEKLSANVGEKVNFDVLMTISDDEIKTGAPVLAGCKCVAEVIEQGKDDKVIVFKYKAKKNVRKKQGHRQPYTAVKILSISK